MEENKQTFREEQKQPLQLEPDINNVNPTFEDIVNYGYLIDIDLLGTDKDIYWVAKMGIETPLPRDWEII